MSTFGGKLELFQNISIDRFDGENLNSEIFFLSHCHLDHMVGLDSPNFLKKITQDNNFIYTSHISAGILKGNYPELSPQIRELDPYSPNHLTNLTVSTISAGHCPGSIMFLFENEDKKVLYTGDYRINPSDLPKFKSFYNSDNTLKRIDEIHLDTTFFLKGYRNFPSRSESLEEICSIIKNWISKSKNHVIQLNTCARYGYEYLFNEISKVFKMPVHVSEEVYDFYRKVPEMEATVTQFGDQTQIHCSCGSTYQVICRNNITFNVKTIKVSAWRWQTDNLQEGISENLTYKSHFVCYSTHASYEEGLALLRFLKPKEVFPNVLHSNQSDSKEIHKNLEECLLEFNEPKESKKTGPKLFQIDETANNVGVEDCQKVTEDFAFGILDSPPRKRKNQTK